MVPEPAQPPMGADWLALKNAVRRFEDAWRAGPRPQIDEFLPAGAGLRCRLLVELVHIDLELRLKAGEAARAEEYLAAFPELAAERARLLELIAAEHEFRRRRERGILVTEYRQRFPQLADEICEIFELATVADGHAPPGPESADEPVPAVAGYAVLGPLGRGGMGVVYAARQLSLDRPVALKFLPAECARDPAWLERFRHEARAASGLNHPNICTIYDTGDCAGRPYLSMELIQGATLEPLIGQRRPARELAGLIAQAARALAAAHAAGVVHRDIKPQNIMVRADGIVKVLDFGLARRLPGAGSDTARHETERGQRVGTIMYMSPEQARAETVDGASDLFSLGLVLYELATGMHPFAADSRSGVLHAIIAHTPAPAACGNPEIPEAMDRLLMQMLAKQSRHRPTAAQVAAELADVAENRLGYAVGVARPRRRATVGRSDERRTLRNAFAAAAAGYGAMVCVTGEAGLGKTTLVEDFLDELTNAGQPVTLARGHCSERLAGTEAYLPVLEALDTLLLGANSAAAAQLMNRVAPSWHVQLAPMATDEPSVGGMTAGAGEAPQERRKRELALFLQELARQRTVVLWLDDVHWADPSTIDLLAYLGNKCAGQRWLLVLTYRPSDLLRSEHPFGPAMLELQARRACREIPLPFLSRADLDSYLSLTFAGHQFPDEFAAVIHARTEGNPLFMVELLQYLSDQGVLVQDRAHWSLLQRAPDLQRELPASVRGMIQRKVDRLDEADRRLLMAASVQGTEFDSAIVAAVLELGAAEVEESLEVLASRHALVRRIRPHEFPDGTLTTRYGFVHVLYQNALYAALQPTRRAAWSGAAAEALLIHYGEQVAAVTTELALLYETARNPACAVDYFLLAARNAVRLFAHREAVALARRGLGLLQTLPDGGAPQRQELPLLLALGVSLVATQGFASREVEATYSRARDLCQRGGDIASSFAVLYGLWNLSLLRCDFTACEELAGQMFALAHGQTDPQFLVMAHNAMQEPPFHRGDLAVARSHQELGLILYEAHRPRTLTAIYGEDPGVSFLMYGALTLWLLGYPEQAVRSCESAQALATELGNPFNVARALYFSALTSCWRRDATSTDDLANRLMTLAKEHGFALLYAGATILRGWCLAIRDEVTSGLELMHKGLTDWQATGAVSHRPLHLALLAETLIRCGRRAEALVIVSEALSVAAATREQFWEAELHRLRGELLCDGTDAGRSKAEECLHTGLGIARRQQARSLELRSAVSLSRLYQATGRRAAAHALLGETCAWFSEGSRTGDLTEANAMLNELS